LKAYLPIFVLVHSPQFIWQGTYPLKRKLVTKSSAVVSGLDTAYDSVSNPETTARNADARVEGQMAKWNQNLDALYVFHLSLQLYG
jgi:hypothetical protein